MERGEEISDSQRLVSDRLSSNLRSHHPNILLMPNHSSHGKDRYLPMQQALSSYYPSIFFDHRLLLVKKTIKAFLSLQDLGMSLLRFDASNIFWSEKDREVKLGGLVLIDASTRSKKIDFQFLARVVEEQFPYCKLSILSYMKDLIERMDNFREEDGDLLVNHMALKSVFERLNFISSAHEQIDFLTPESKNIYFRGVVDNMSRSSTNKNDWRKTIVDFEKVVDNMFRSSTNLEDGRKTIVDFARGPVSDCFNYKPRAEPAHYENTNLDILRFSRNMAKHLRKHLIKHKDKGFKGTADEIDTIIMNMFGHELLSFQKLAYDHKILKDIMPGYISRNSSSQHKEGTPPQNSTIPEDDEENGWIRVKGKKSTAPPGTKKYLR